MGYEARNRSHWPLAVAATGFSIVQVKRVNQVTLIICSTNLDLCQKNQGRIHRKWPKPADGDAKIRQLVATLGAVQWMDDESPPEKGPLMWEVRGVGDSETGLVPKSSDYNPWKSPQRTWLLTITTHLDLRVSQKSSGIPTLFRSWILESPWFIPIWKKIVGSCRSASNSPAGVLF